MSWVHHGNMRAHVAWWPRDARLHYAALCCGIYEYLREPPCLTHLGKATEYLAELNQYPHAPMQRDRILWTREWIRGARAVLAG